MSKLDKKSPEFAAARDELKALSAKIKDGEAELGDARGRQREQLPADDPERAARERADRHQRGRQPGAPHVGRQADASRSRRRPHWELGEALGILDFEAGARIAGARFTVLRGGASRLTRALINYMLDLHTAHGYAEVWPPAIVRRASLRGTGQLPKFEDDLFQLAMPVGPDHVADNDLFLSPTAEVQVTNLHADQILDAERAAARATARTRRASAPRPAPPARTPAA